MKKKTPAGTGAGATTGKTNNNVPGPVQKLQFKKRLSREPLTVSELKLLNIITDGQNSKTGEFIQSNKTLAENIGMTPRTVKRAMARLRKKGYIVLVRPGRRDGYANVWTLGSVTDDTTLSEVVTPEVKGSDMEGQNLVTPTTPLSIPLSEVLPRIERNRSAEGDAMPGGPAGAALGQRQPGKSTPGKDLYPEFWNAYPLRAGVSNAEAKLQDLIEAGADYEEILAGARRYAEYCKATKQVKRSPADSWLHRQSWRDEWSAPKAKESNIVSMPTRKSAKPARKTSKKKTETKPPKAEVIRLTPRQEKELRDKQKRYEDALEKTREARKEWVRERDEIDGLIDYLEREQLNLTQPLDVYITNEGLEKFKYWDIDELTKKVAEWQSRNTGKAILHELIKATETLNEWKQRKHEHFSKCPQNPNKEDFF